MYEYEFRIRIILDNFQSIQRILEAFPSVNNYTVKYAKQFRCKSSWELKKKLRQTMVYHVKSSCWLKFVESVEIPFSNWKLEYYENFKEQLAFQQNIFDIEYRYEVQLDKNAKIYGYNKKFKEYGIVFELEIYNDKHKLKKLPVLTDELDRYINVLSLFYKKTNPPYILQKCIRKPVISTNVEIPDSLKALKYDGIFGHLYSYKNYIFEEWEDGKRYLFENETLGDGFVYGAERLENRVIILYVAQVRGLDVYNIFDILLKYLITITSNALPRYKIQYYYENHVPIQCHESDGIIFHTKKNEIYKMKKRNTIDLLYENGFFVTKDGLIQCSQTDLTNGTVYECDLNCNVIRPRHDRFVSNTPKQIKEIFKSTKKKLQYCFLYSKSQV